MTSISVIVPVVVAVFDIVDVVVERPRCQILKKLLLVAS